MPDRSPPWLHSSEAIGNRRGLLLKRLMLTSINDLKHAHHGLESSSDLLHLCSSRKLKQAQGCSSFPWLLSSSTSKRSQNVHPGPDSGSRVHPIVCPFLPQVIVNKLIIEVLQGFALLLGTNGPEPRWWYHAMSAFSPQVNQITVTAKQSGNMYELEDGDWIVRSIARAPIDCVAGLGAKSRMRLWPGRRRRLRRQRRRLLRRWYRSFPRSSWVPFCGLMWSVTLVHGMNYSLSMYMACPSPGPSPQRACTLASAGDREGREGSSCTRGLSAANVANRISTACRIAGSNFSRGGARADRCYPTDPPFPPRQDPARTAQKKYFEFESDLITLPDLRTTSTVQSHVAVMRNVVCGMRHGDMGSKDVRKANAAYCDCHAAASS